MPPSIPTNLRRMAPFRGGRLSTLATFAVLAACAMTVPCAQANVGRVSGEAGAAIPSTLLVPDQVAKSGGGNYGDSSHGGGHRRDDNFDPYGKDDPWNGKGKKGGSNPEYLHNNGGDRKKVASHNGKDRDRKAGSYDDDREDHRNSEDREPGPKRGSDGGTSQDSGSGE